MAAVRSIGLNSAKSLLRLTYHRLFRMYLRIRCFVSDGAAGRAGRALPPSLLRYRVSESFSRKSFLSIGEACARQIQDMAAGCGINALHTGRVLDFGCGCGRTLRWLLSQPHSSQFAGADVDAEAIQWCREHLSAANFAVTQMRPPLPFSSGSFDLIYSVSVFTHLPEEVQDLWLAELARVLRPGGVIILSVHGHNAEKGLTPANRQMLQSAGFLHLESGKLSGIVPDGYHTSWHTTRYIVNRLGPWFQQIRYDTIPDGMQDYVVAVRAVPVTGGLER